MITLLLRLKEGIILLGFNPGSVSGMGGNGATGFFLTFAILAAVAGIVSKVAGWGHIRSWRSDSLAEAGSSSLIAWALTALAFG